MLLLIIMAHFPCLIQNQKLINASEISLDLLLHGSTGIFPWRHVILQLLNIQPTLIINSSLSKAIARLLAQVLLIMG